LKQRFLDLGVKIGSGFVSPRERRERFFPMKKKIVKIKINPYWEEIRSNVVATNDVM
jgi:hypothetical protein